MNRLSAEKQFPASKPESPVYLERHSWFRYAFYIATTSLFAGIFWYYAVTEYLAGRLFEGANLITVAGSIIGPLLPLLYYLRYRRSGYAVTGEAVYFKDGFFFQKEGRIFLNDIVEASLVQEKTVITKEMGNIRLRLSSGETKFLLDARDPKRLLKAVRNK